MSFSLGSSPPNFIFVPGSRASFPGTVAVPVHSFRQASVCPPNFVIFCNSRELFHYSYQRYIENQLRETFGLTATPIKLTIRERGE